ncbi:MAG: hypothetical protein WDZ83_20790 [Rhizobiaceae bacterium]
MAFRFQLQNGSRKTSIRPNLAPKKSELLEQFSVLTHRSSRAVFRRELRRNANYYATLSHKHPGDSCKHRHFMLLSRIHQEVLREIGEEPAPKPRKARRQTPICYPKLPADLPLRLHFFAEGSLRRERAAALSRYGGATAKQLAVTGETYLSVAVSRNDTFLFERLVETLGETGLARPRSKTGGFACHDGGSHTDAAFQIIYENNHARTYSWRHSVLARSDDSIEIPTGVPIVPDDLPWDPDPLYRDILSMTEANDLEGALSVVEAVDPAAREILFDEVIYLKFCLRVPLRAQDLRYIARKYLRRSSMRGRIEAEFDLFLGLLDPLLPDWNELEQVYPWKELRRWPVFKKRAYQALTKFGHPVGPRGRLFVWHPDIYSGRAQSVDDAFVPSLRAAEDAFRRGCEIPQIGRRWSGESALADLTISVFPDAIRQWSPPWLGRQSVDIYIPSINVALEYQGEQHFRPIEFFGGEQAFRKTQKRDADKRRRLARRGVILIEWNHGRPINEAELRQALDDAGISGRPKAAS